MKFIPFFLWQNPINKREEKIQRILSYLYDLRHKFFTFFFLLNGNAEQQALA